MYATIEDMRRTRQDIAFSVARAYYNALRAEIILNARTEAVAQMEQHLKVAQTKYEVGKAAKLDVLRAEVQLADVTQAKLLAANQLDISRLELANAMGMEAESPQVTPIKDEQPSPAFMDSSPFLDEALKMHPDYLRSVLLTKSATSNVRSAKGDFRPELSLVSSYNREGKDFPDIDNWNVGLVVTMPLYNGGITRAKIGQAKAVVEQSKSNSELVKQNITLAVRSAVLSTQDAASRLQATQKSMEQAGEALRVAQEKYNAGLGSSTEVIDTQVALTQAETNYTNALYDGKIASAQLDYAVGRDPKIVGAESATAGGLNK
jgi:outer membrane protein